MTTTSFDGAVPTTAGTTTARAPRPADTTTGAGFATTAITTSRRTVLQFFRTPQVLFMGSIQGALFLFMFRYVFGGAINPGGDLDYVNFLVPGFLVTVILWSGMSAAAGVAEESSTGVHDRLRSLPIPRSAVMAGRSIADGALVAWGIFVTAIIGVLVGWRPDGGVTKIAIGFGLMIIAGYAFTWIFIFIGLMAGNAQAAQGLSMLVIPFSFISSANVPVSSMPGWMQPFAANQPISVIINSVRGFMIGDIDQLGLGHSLGYWTVLSLLWSAGILLVFGFLSVRRFSRMK
jgi:ABC-2 type transport system permease protein